MCCPLVAERKTKQKVYEALFFYFSLINLLDCCCLMEDDTLFYLNVREMRDERKTEEKPKEKHVNIYEVRAVARPNKVQQAMVSGLLARKRLLQLPLAFF